VPFHLDSIYRELGSCTVFMAFGTSGSVEPAASFAAHVRGRARTVYVGPEQPVNQAAFTESHLGKSGELLPDLLAKSLAKLL